MEKKIHFRPKRHKKYQKYQKMRQTKIVQN